MFSGGVLEPRAIRWNIECWGGRTTVGQEMPKLNNSGIRENQATGDNCSPGKSEFELLLREIEKEPIPERLLDLAMQLQRALVAQRQSESEDKKPDQHPQ